jgi:hypothetical protein
MWVLKRFLQIEWPIKESLRHQSWWLDNLLTSALRNSNQQPLDTWALELSQSWILAKRVR